MKRKHLALAVASCFSLAGGAHAQQAASGPGASDSSTTITVTARRREESLQDVPAAVTAFTGDMLDKVGIPDVTALAEMLPNTTLKTSRATNTTLTAFIRGVGQQDPVAGYEQGVGVYLDDIYLARPQGAVMDIYDVERIEVLRGPQGTLYGRNTIGGAVKYVTKRLGAKPEVEVKATLGDYGQADVVVKGSTPVGGGLRVGGTIANFSRDGFGKNVVNGKENYNKDVTAGRISLEWNPSNAVFVRLAADRTEDDSLPRVGHRLTAGPAPGNEPVLKGDYDTRAGLYTVLGKQQEVITSGESLLVEWALNPALTFKSVTAHRAGESVAPIDFDSLQGKLFEAPALYHDDQFSQEFQFTYIGDKVQGVAGIFYMDANAYNRFDAILPNAGGLSLLTLDDIDTKTWAAFVDLSYELSNTVNVSLGGRYTEDKRNARIFKATYLGNTGSPTLGNPAAVQFGPADTDMSKDDLAREDTKFTPKIGIDWKVSPTQTAYATYAEGFKGGMFDPRMALGGNPNSAASVIKRKGVEPEEVKSIELGLKSRFANGRVQTNAAVFSMDYQNVQIPGSVPIDSNGDGVADNFAGTLTNAGKADIMGLEFEALARVSDNFSVTAMYSYIDAEYKEWITLMPAAAGAPATLVNVAKGAEFQNTPRNSAHLSGTYEWPLALFGRAGSLALTPSIAYKGKTYQFENARTVGVASWDAVVPQAKLLAQDAYTLYDLSLVWTSKDRKVQAGIHGRNLTDKRYKVAGYTFAGFSNTITTFYGDPRTVAATVRVRF